jgi:hypothetical protein
VSQRLTPAIHEFNETVFGLHIFHFTVMTGLGIRRAGRAKKKFAHPDWVDLGGFGWIWVECSFLGLFLVFWVFFGFFWFLGTFGARGPSIHWVSIGPQNTQM